MFPFKDQSTFKNAVIYFQKEKSRLSFIGWGDIVRMKYRVSTNNITIDNLRMNSTPEMLVKLGDGTILIGDKDRVSTLLLNAIFFICVF